nr:16S rRNA (cytosine(967)-C(5))-methyltransferase RsmB [Anaerocolumna cellulosilytica]
MSGKAPREIAFDILNDILEKGSFSHTVMANTLNQYQYLKKQDRAFITRLCEGTLERIITLDYLLNQYSSVKVLKMKPVIRNILRMGLYQIKYMEVPPSAACNEAVKLTKKRGFTGLSGFVNGVLRSIIREPDKAKFPEESKDKVSYLSIVYSIPDWIIKGWLNQYDYDTVKQMLEGFLSSSKETSIRCNLNKVSVSELKEALTQSQVKIVDGEYLPYALKISEYNYLNQLTPFLNGCFQVQDESSMLVGELSKAKPGDYVIDVCAAPGGKALHIAETMEGSGHVEARDVTQNKVRLIEDNINRLGYRNITARVWDAFILDEESVSKADLVIADLPCSGLGIIGKKPDIKYNMTTEKQKSLVQLQRDILKVVTQYVKPGGILMYSTCTINPGENEENVKWLLETFDFAPESLEEILPPGLKIATAKKGYLQLLPGIHGTDGFFIARFKRKV